MFSLDIAWARNGCRSSSAFDGVVKVAKAGSLSAPGAPLTMGMEGSGLKVWPPDLIS